MLIHLQSMYDEFDYECTKFRDVIAQTYKTIESRRTDLYLI